MFYHKESHIKFAQLLNQLFHISRKDLFYISRIYLHAMKSYSCILLTMQTFIISTKLSKSEILKFSLYNIFVGMIIPFHVLIVVCTGSNIP